MEIKNKFKNYNVLIYDHHPIVYEHLKNILSKINSINHISFTSSYREAIDKIAQYDIDLLVLDVYLNDSDGFQFLRRVKSHGYDGQTLFFSSNEKEYCSKLAFDLGANGYIYKGESLEVITHALKSILNGYNQFKYPDNSRFVAGPCLSRMEVIVLNYLLKGMRNKDIANILGLSPKSISAYKRQLLEKHQAANLFELVEMNRRSC